nr:MAG TPA: hypothetical protein [Caudoviricetes sp.]DAG81382.1 MAG TPA: hypothetical protein [Caudoviricetes sp.]DAL39974.1 MAG TPA_asm: hypothetical protein [Caudoviricetes sp.]DAM95019.1 MAG TPA: hypothetical protein [Caudoviricetes sp.]DAU32222.1 MAG TPA: hypothetical protein [Caudoviricetes sp.]
MFLFLPVSRPRGESAGPPGRTPKQKSRKGRL